MTVNLNKVAVIPWIPGEPEAWFRLLEAAFAREKIETEGDKCFLVNKYALSSDIAKITAIACKATYNDGDYEKLKATLIAMNTLTDDEKFSQLLSDEELGDQRPSELYHKLNGMASSISTGPVPKNVVFNRWVSKLPTDVISFVKTLSDNFDPDKHLRAVDDLVAALASRRANGGHMAAVQNRPRSNSRARSNSRPRNRNRSQSRNRGPRGQQKVHYQRNNRHYDENGELCWYHHTFGKQAIKCGKPECPMKGNASQ